jgi:hypothetical protein
MGERSEKQKQLFERIEDNLEYTKKEECLCGKAESRKANE